jgi:hypothetical protein
MSEITLHEVRDRLVAAGITGPHQSHSRQNNLSHIRTMLEDDADGSFGLSGLSRYSAGEVLGFLAEITGCSSDLEQVEGFDTIDPERTVAALVEAGRKLGDAARRGENLLAVTGHPTGMLEHHVHIVQAYQRAGGKLLRLREEENLNVGKSKHAEVRYIGGVGCLADWGALKHTHSSAAMEALLESKPWPDLVLGDHGFAGAAIERGIPTIAVMDINDPALAVAWAEKKDVLIIPMDDNRGPRKYEPAWLLIIQEMVKNTL